MKLDLKKIYYYLIALVAALILLLGTIDLVSASVSMAAANINKPPQVSDKNVGEPGVEDYYQGRVAQDRILDSLSRMLVSGAVFLYARKKINGLEEK